MGKKTIALICLSLLTSTTLWAQNSQRFVSRVFDNITVQSEIQYSEAAPVGSDDPDPLYFDFYEPANDTMSYRPLVITVFGGAFVAGNRSWCDMVAYGDSLSHYGYVVASIDYRLISVYRISETNFIRGAYMGAQDVSAAVRFFKGNCDLYRIDTNRIFIIGNSAGTIASMHCVWMDEDERPEETYEDSGWLGIGGHSDLGGVHTSGSRHRPGGWHRRTGVSLLHRLSQSGQRGATPPACGTEPAVHLLPIRPARPPAFAAG